PDAADFWQHGIYMLPTPANWLEKNAELRPLAEQVINALSQGQTIGDDINLMHHLAAINDNSHALNDWVYAQTAQCLCDGKITGLVGGEHSTPLGFIRALSEIHNEFGILHIDAHADLRHAYEGFTYSHASIMYNALQYPQITRLVSVGLRDVCDEEMERIADSNGRIRAFFDRDLKNQIYIERKRTWADQCKKMISKLPKKVYISFDIDGLDPSLCPNTGTPVP
ncbi:MAG TPA: arginase family protein, partial [Chitinophagales bacterium]|nr:arginase family protein [Chitinophagales bacterium]